MRSWTRSILRFARLWAAAVPASLIVASIADAETLAATIASAGSERSYLLYVPDNYRGEPIPLVLSLHGSGGEPGAWLDGSRLTPLADREGFAVAFPAGAFENSVSQRSWNANVETGVDDVQFMRDLIADASNRIRIDAARIYSTGFSGGARMTSRLACELADVLAAAAPVAGVQYPDGCTPVRPIPLLAIHSRADPVNPYELTGDARPYWRMGVETAVERWRLAQGCATGPETISVADTIEQRHWAACDRASEIRFYIIADGGHSWPDWAPETIWAFFDSHSL